MPTIGWCRSDWQGSETVSPSHSGYSASSCLCYVIILKRNDSFNLFLKFIYLFLPASSFKISNSLANNSFRRYLNYMQIRHPNIRILGSDRFGTYRFVFSNSGADMNSNSPLHFNALVRIRRGFHSDDGSRAACPADAARERIKNRAIVRTVTSPVRFMRGVSSVGASRQFDPWLEGSLQDGRLCVSRFLSHKNEELNVYSYSYSYNLLHRHSKKG